jgi:thioredoxin:protein disulfide reductase
MSLQLSVAHMILTASTLRRLLALATAWALLPLVALAPTASHAQAPVSAAAAVTHSAGTSGMPTPAAMSSLLDATHAPSTRVNPLSPELAFKVSAAAASPDSVRIDWQIADGYYLYRSRIKVKTAGPVQLGALALPVGKSQTDEYFGTQQIYEQAVSATLPVVRSGGTGDLKLAVDVTYQGCAHAGFCYPPMTRTLAVTLPPSPPAQAGNDRPNFLTPDQAFQVAATAGGPDSVRIDWQIADGYYLYRSRIKVRTASPVQLGALALPQGKSQTDDYFGTQQIYEHAVSASLPVARPGGAGNLNVAVDVTYQGCAHAGLCYSPITKTLAVSLPPAGAGGGGTSAAAPDTAPSATATAASPGAFVSEQDSRATFIRTGNLLWVVVSFFGSGLLLSLTPCVLPMVPILSGIIAGHGTNVTTMRAFMLSLTYVLGMACTYTVAGIAVAAAGSHVQALFQQTWIIVLFAALFVVLALSMMGLFTIQMPAAIQTRLSAASNRQTAGSFGGVAVMGALSALIVTTCVAPPLVAAFVVIGQSGNIVRGAIALFALSLGMGAPLLVVGASQGKLLPKAGPWMDTIKQLFGVMMLGVAAWMLARVIPPRAVLLLWAVPAAIAAWVLWRGAHSIKEVPMLVRTVAVAAGVYALVLVAGAGLGATDPLAPFPALASHHEELAFRTIKSSADLDREVAQAQAGGHPLMLDFYADWCVSCKEMEKYTFTDPAVRATLKNVVLLRADVTANDADDQALLKRFGIYGPPTIAFYGTDGQERAPYRVVGFMKASEFAELSRKAIGSTTAITGARAAGQGAAAHPS